MQSCVPSLTQDGFLTNKKTQMYKIWEYFLTSDYSQSTSFRGKIKSFRYILAAYKTIDLKAELESNIKELFNAYFDTTRVSVSVVTNDDTNTQYCKIAVVCTDGSNTYSLYQEIKSTAGEIDNYETLLDELYEQYATAY